MGHHRLKINKMKKVSAATKLSFDEKEVKVLVYPCVLYRYVFFGPKWHSLCTLLFQGVKKSRFSGPTPSNGPRNGFGRIRELFLPMLAGWGEGAVFCCFSGLSWLKWGPKRWPLFSPSQYSCWVKKRG